MGVATIYNYYQTKVKLVIAISGKIWGDLWKEILEEKGIEFPAASDECALQRAYPYCQVGVVLLDMDVYRAYREYRMEQAELDSAEWAEKSKRRRLTLFQRVFGGR